MAGRRDRGKPTTGISSGGYSLLPESISNIQAAMHLAKQSVAAFDEVVRSYAGNAVIEALVLKGTILSPEQQSEIVGILAAIKGALQSNASVARELDCEARSLGELMIRCVAIDENTATHLLAVLTPWNLGEERHQIADLAGHRPHCLPLDALAQVSVTRVQTLCDNLKQTTQYLTGSLASLSQNGSLDSRGMGR